MARLSLMFFVIALAYSNSGCAALIAADAIGRHDDRRRQEIQYRHQERMRELDIQEKRLKLLQQQQLPSTNTDGGIVRDAPY